MQRGSVTLRVTAEGRTRDVTFTATRGCPSNVELVPGEAVNAWADGTRVIVSEGLLDKCASDADLALVIGHEMAHNLLHHRRRLGADRIVANSLLPMTGAASQEIRETEEEADRVGAGLAIAAAYDLADFETFMTTLVNPRIQVAGTHPEPSRRLLLLRAAIDEARHGLARRAMLSA
jgi:predicted Zn-dependent protease